MSRESEAAWRDVVKLRDFLTELDPSTMHSRIRELRRGGLPSASMGGGSRGAETPLPLPDTVDQWLARQWRTYRANLAQAVGIIAGATQAQRSVLTVMADNQLPTIPCGNLGCGELLEDGRQTGECGRCRVHRHRHGLAYPLTQEKTA